MKYLLVLYGVNDECAGKCAGNVKEIELTAINIPQIKCWVCKKAAGTIPVKRKKALTVMQGLLSGQLM